MNVLREVLVDELILTGILHTTQSRIAIPASWLGPGYTMTTPAQEALNPRAGRAIDKLSHVLLVVLGLLRFAVWPLAQVKALGAAQV